MGTALIMIILLSICADSVSCQVKPLAVGEYDQDLEFTAVWAGAMKE